MTSVIVPAQPKKRLRPYQADACKAVFTSLQEGEQRVVVAMPTGSGKTMTAAEFTSTLVKQFKGNVLWIAHREELLDQAEKAFSEQAPELRLTQWRANKKDASGDIVVASIGSTRTLKGHFMFVVFDEGHHYAIENEDESDYSNMYMKLLKQIKWHHLIGLTATPERLDGRMLGYDKIAYSITFLDLVRRHRLAKPIYIEMLTKQSVVLQVRGGEYTKKSLAQLNNKDRNKKIAQEYVAHRVRYGKGLMFVSGVQHCYDMRDAILDLDPTCEIRIIHGNHKKYPFTKVQRRENSAWFSEGGPRTQKLLINCEVYTEGLDEPSVRSVWLCRPTMSKGLWMQMVGRGARVWMGFHNVAMSHIVKRTPEGGDGIEKFTFDNKAEYYGEDFGQVSTNAQGDPIHKLSLHLEKEFYLVQVMDDIGKFHALVSDWQLDVREKTEEELEEEHLGTLLAEKRIALKVLKDDCSIEEEEMDLAELGDAVVRDILGVLIISTYFQKNMGIPCDAERQAVLYNMDQFASNDCTYMRQRTVMEYDQATGQNNPKTVHEPFFDIEKFREEAYTHCVSAGEFPPSVFKKLLHAYYFRFKRGQVHIKPQGSSQFYDTWRYMPITELTAESRQHHVQIAVKRAEVNRQLNEEFNTEYDTRDKLLALWKEVQDMAYDEVADKQKNPKATRRTLTTFLQTCTVTKGQHRQIYLFTDRIIDGPRTGSQFAYVSKILSEAFREVLDDPNALVTITPRKVTYDKPGTRVGA